MSKCAVCGQGGWGQPGNTFRTKDGKKVCSDRCARDYNLNLMQSGGGSGDSSTGSNQSSGGGFSNWTKEAMKSDEEKLIEKGLSGEEIARIKEVEAKADLEAKKEYTKRMEIEEKMSLERAKLRAEKAEKLREEGKNFQAFILLHRGWSVAIVVITLFIGFIIMGKIGSAMEESALQSSINQSEELEKIESKIMLGINAGENKEKLLELVDQLKHDDAENYIHGRKMGIIKASYGYAPENEFHGKYSEYWTAKREAFKEIILSGKKIEEFMNSVKKDAGNNFNNNAAKSEETSDNNNSENIESQPTSMIDDNSSLLGVWEGSFGNDQISISIETVNADGSVTGTNEVKGNKRGLTGTMTKNGTNSDFVLNEPGDDEWDGVFKFTIIDNTATGTWTANNGKSTKQFSLTK
jgi:hypothetical protein